jgi:phenylpropionate dioxygenase-like ring-hydroxylating dioxygenase large terminal subunit
MNIEKPNYPKNCWWLGGTSEEIGDKPLGRWLLNEPVVFYRKEDGRVAALEDRCPHRWAQLSNGRVVGDTIVCPYHGFRYAADGRCVHIPTQSKIPEGARVRSYPVVERRPFVWIWMGDPYRVDEINVPDLEFVTGAGWIQIAGSLHLNANYFLLQENVLDLTHFAFVHAATLEFAGWDSGEDEVFVREQTVNFRRVTRQGPLPPFLTIPACLKSGEIADNTTFGTMLLPGVHIAGIDIGDPYRGKNNGHDFNFRIAHLTTPESTCTTHYWWIIGQNYGASGSKENDAVYEIIAEAFNQDKDVLEQIQRTVAKDPRHSDSIEVSVLADRSAVQARRILQSMLANDQRQETTAAPAGHRDMGIGQPKNG